MADALLGPLLVATGGALALVALVVVARTPASVALAVYAFVLPFGSAVRLPFGSSPFSSLSSVVGVLATVVLLMQVMARRRGPLDVDASVGGWMLLLGWLVLTLLWTADPARSLGALLVLTSLIALHTVACLTPSSRRDVRLLELATVAGALVVAGLAVLLTAIGRSGEPGSRRAGFRFEEGDPNITAATLLLGLVLTAWWALDERSPRRRMASLAASCVILLGIALTGSRGGLGAAVIGLVAVFAQSGRLPRGRLAAFLGTLAVLVPVAVLAMPPTLTSRLLSGNSTGRVAIWEVGLRSCRETCLTGNGVGTFGHAYRDVYLSDLTVQGFGDHLWAAHNTFLSMLIEGGVIGVVVLIASFLLLLTSLRRLPPAWRGPPIAALAALVASNMFLSNLNFKYFWFPITYATLMVHAHRAAAPTPARPWLSDVA